MKRHVGFGMALILAFGAGSEALQAKTALEFLQEAPKPRYRQGHTLLPLTRWGWTMPFDVRVELCENWGYAFDLLQAVQQRLDRQQ